MRFWSIFVVIGAVAGAAAPSPPIAAQPPADIIAPALPQPPVGDNEPAAAFLRAARLALATGRSGEARQALEMAQTRLLDRSVPLFKTDTPSAHPAVPAIRAALDALAAGDRYGAMRDIDRALPLAVVGPQPP